LRNPKGLVRETSSLESSLTLATKKRFSSLCASFSVDLTSLRSSFFGTFCVLEVSKDGGDTVSIGFIPFVFVFCK
jgi:hypothetical protein